MIHESATAQPRARRREANLERILDAALALVARDGLDALHMARLADAVDYTPGALYRYVASKDALIAALVARTLAQVGDELAAALAALPPRATPLARIAAMVGAYARFARRAPHAFGLLAAALAAPRVLVADADATRVTAAAVIAALTPLATALDAAVAADQLTAGPTLDRTLCLFALVHGLAQLPKLGRAAPTRLDVDATLAVGIRALLIGWGAGPRAVDAALPRLTELP
jgi:AcrR family transcriptional regulator